MQKVVLKTRVHSKIVGINNNAVGRLNFKNVTTMHPGTIITTDMAVGNYLSELGDSGAPIIFRDGNVNKIIGVHEGIICTFSNTDTGEILRDYYDNPLLCPTETHHPYYKVFTPWENVKSNLNLR